MDAQLTQIRDQQKETWNTFSPGWKKWDSWVLDYLRPQGEAIIDKLRVKETDVVLDVATGTGEPGISLAKIAKKGRVIGADISEGMLAVARENAAKQGVTNYSTQAADACEIPYPDQTFDAVSCRLGFMFFPDMELAAKEMMRVLKKDGRFATTVWSIPEKNPWVTMIMGTINKHLDLPAPPKDAPGMFRSAEPGLLKKILEKAGLKDVKEEVLEGIGEAESPEIFWTYMNDVAAPVVGAMSMADDATREKIKTEVFAKIHEYQKTEGPLKLNWEARVISGHK
jgi:ubiquinone/menaquinone biosynthesis C-methylase UbiE